MNQTRKSHGKTLVILGFIVVLMFAFGYALVPLYNVFCKLTGLNGKTGGATSLSSSAVDNSREVTVEFVATNNANLAWKFYPLQSKIMIHPGENKRVAYFAENDSGKVMTVQAIPSVAPGVAASYLKKTECFCFTQQTLQPGQALDMPIVFHIDSALPKDIKIITLSYTLFDAKGFAPKADKQGKIN